MLPAVENAMDAKVEIRWNKNVDKRPEARNASCETLLQLVSVIDANLGSTSVLNMVAKVRRVEG